MRWIFLALAIVGELVGTSALKSSDGFSRLGPTVVSIIGFLFAFYFLSLTLKVIPVGIAYAIWSAVGIVLVSIIDYLLHGQKLDLAAIAGIGLIVTGVLVMNVFSKSVSH